MAQAITLDTLYKFASSDNAVHGQLTRAIQAGEGEVPDRCQRVNLKHVDYLSGGYIDLKAAGLRCAYKHMGSYYREETRQSPPSRALILVSSN